MKVVSQGRVFEDMSKLVKKNTKKQNANWPFFLIPNKYPKNTKTIRIAPQSGAFGIEIVFF